MFLAEYFLGNFYWHLAAFYWSHCILASDAPGRRNWELIFNFFQRFLLKLIQIRRWRRRRRQWWRRRLHRGRRVLKRRTPFCEKNGERKIEGSTGGLVCGLGGVQPEKPDSIPVWPEKNRQMSIKLAQKWFHYKNDRFWHLYKNCQRMWEIWAN